MKEVEMKIADIFLEVIEDTGISKEELIIAPLSELGLNSISFIKIIVMIESEYDIEMDPESLDMAVFMSIASIATHVRSILE